MNIQPPRALCRRNPLKIITTLALVLALVTLIGLASLPVRAGSHTGASVVTVDTLNDESDSSCTDGDCSLRDAIAVAQAGDTIEFGVTGTITLTIDQLTVDKNLAISGPGAGDLTISGDDTHRVFWINESVDATLSNLTIADGQGQDGGGIFNRGGDLTLIGCTLTGNRSTYDGGGVSNRFDGTLTVSNCLFSGNTARNGAAIDNRETLTVSGTTFTHNSASTWGGGIYNYQGIATITGSTFTGNGELTDNGGAICNDRGTVQVTSSEFSANEADLTGGAIYTGGDGGVLMVTGSGFDGNTTARGGGIHNASLLTVINTTFSNNQVPLNGGGIHNTYVLTVTGSTFYSNTAQWGGGIENFYRLDLSSSTFSNNSVTDTGGGICSHGALTVTNATPYTNTAGPQSGGINNNEGTLYVTNSTFVGNQAQTDGGAIRNGETTTLINTIVANSVAGGNCSGSALDAASTHGLSTDATCSPGFAQTTNTALAMNWQGWVFELITDSVAIDAGTNAGCPAADQLGQPRPQDGDENGTAVCDVGSFELSTLTEIVYLPLVLK